MAQEFTRDKLQKENRVLKACPYLSQESTWTLVTLVRKLSFSGGPACFHRQTFAPLTHAASTSRSFCEHHDSNKFHAIHTANFPSKQNPSLHHFLATSKLHCSTNSWFLNKITRNTQRLFWKTVQCGQLCSWRNRRKIFIETSCALMVSGAKIYHSMLRQLCLHSSSRYLW